MFVGLCFYNFMLALLYWCATDVADFRLRQVLSINKNHTIF